MHWRKVHIADINIIRICEKAPCTGNKSPQRQKIKKTFKKVFTNVPILGIIDRQSGRRAETEH